MLPAAVLLPMAIEPDEPFKSPTTLAFIPKAIAFVEFCSTFASLPIAIALVAKFAFTLAFVPNATAEIAEA